MARKTPLVSMRPISEISLTPLMDLTFLLLITFVITYPLMEQGISVDLPKANAQKLSPDKTETVSVDRQGKVFWNEKAVTLDELERHLVSLARTSPTSTVLVRADENVQYGLVVQVMKRLNQAKISKMALVTQAE